jgi:hypothetical protein
MEISSQVRAHVTLTERKDYIALEAGRGPIGILEAAEKIKIGPRSSNSKTVIMLTDRNVALHNAVKVLYRFYNSE